MYILRRLCQGLSNRCQEKENHSRIQVRHFKAQTILNLFSRNFFVTNRCLNLGQERVRRICRDLETRGDCSEYSCIVNLAFRFLAQQLERDATNMIRRAENAMRTKWANTNNAFKLGMFLKIISHRQNKGRELARALGLEICCRPI